MLMYIYLALVAFIVVLLFFCMFRSDRLFFQIDAAMVLVTLLLRLLRVK